MALSSSEHSAVGGETGETSYCSWIAFWLQLIVLALVAVLGAFFASGDADSSDYNCGMIAIVAAVVLAFMRIKARLDGESAVDWRKSLLVDDMGNLIAVIVVLTALGLGGLFIAADAGSGGLHDGGVALFVTSALGILLSIKNVFDNLERRH